MAKQVASKVNKAAPVKSAIMTNDNNKVSKSARKKKKVSDRTADRKLPEVFGIEPPSRLLRLPQVGNITAAELIAFLPNWLRSHDVLFRFMQNGLDTPTLAKIVNNYRRFSDRARGGGAIPNSLCKLLQKTMRESGNQGWTVIKHNPRDYIEVDKEWDADNLAMTGFKLHCEDFPNLAMSRQGPIDNIDFTSLAIGVNRFPSERRGDALDLTRCVLYALKHPDEDLKFPRDFVALVTRLGGPRFVDPANRDNAVFQRWKDTPVTRNVGSRNTWTVDQCKAMTKTVQGEQVAVGQSTNVDAAKPSHHLVEVVAGSHHVAGSVQGERPQEDVDMVQEQVVDPVLEYLHSPDKVYEDAFVHAPAFQPLLTTEQDYERAWASLNSHYPPPKGFINERLMGYPGGYMKQQAFVPNFYGGYYNDSLTGHDNADFQVSSPDRRHNSVFSPSDTLPTLPSSTPSTGDQCQSSFDFSDPTTPVHPAFTQGAASGDSWIQGLSELIRRGHAGYVEPNSRRFNDDFVDGNHFGDPA